MLKVERLKIAIEEVALVRMGLPIVWQEQLDEEARTLAVGYISDHDAPMLGRKLKDDTEIAWDREQELLVREARLQGKECMAVPLPESDRAPLTQELVDKYRIDILQALLREGAVNTKF